MEEEVGIKVTRLRRRLSVEAEDVKSPSTQSTPTKKRGGRLAAKPQLELIDENAPEAAPKKTRKSTVKEVEPVEEKPITPSRRSTRIRSNTSIVSETPGDGAEDKGTPSRRSTRIKSNTSLIAEPVNVNSPRAKRAARRTSLVGSDTEAPITPARSTRRTRNNSTSSIDKPVEPIAGKLGSEIKEVIVEESENNVKETPSKTETSKNDSLSVRKSPRLVGKSGRNSSSLDNENKENEPRSDKEAGDTTAAADKSVSEPKLEQATVVVDQKASDQINLSATSKNLIQELQEAPKKAKSIFNKNTTAVEEPQIKTKRNRTKSWNTISVESPQESSFCSDSEASKKKNKKDDSLTFSNISGSGDGIINTSNKNNEADKKQDNVSLNSSTLSNKKKKRHEKSMTVETETSVHDVSILNTSVNKSATKLTEVKDGSEEINNLNSSKQQNTSVIQKLFEQAPSGVVQSLVFIEDSDSNQEKENKGFDSGDQCVPVVIHQLENETAKETKVNLSYEPMDIDETMPENVSLTNFVDENESASEKRKSLLNMSQVNVKNEKNYSLNKSKRKSVIPDLSLENNFDETCTKSPRKSSISEVINDGVGDNNKSKRKSSITNEVSEDTTDGIVNVSNRNSSAVDDYNHDDSINNKKANKSKRMSSLSNVVTEHNTDEDSNNSARKSLIAENSNDASIKKESNKSKRKSSISYIISEENTDDSYKSTRKSSVDLVNDENMDKCLNKSKRKSSVTAMVVELSTDKIKTSILDDNEDMINKSSNKSKRKSSISNIPNDDSINKNSDKSKNKSALYLDKTENENENVNKSTLVLSQLKDVSENEINAESNMAKDDSNELSKSVNVPNVVSEKDDKKNLSLTYSTSTPLQQKAMKKLGLQINTSIIAPNSANKTEKTENLIRSKKEASIMSEEEGSDSSEEDEDTEEESEEEASLKKSKMLDDEAEEASDDYESGDSRDEEEREYEKENLIREKGETLDSDEVEFSDDSDYEKDSFIVSSDEEDKYLLSGSGDDLSMSADELTMTAKSKKKFNERKIKEQKKASREMYEARHQLNESDKSKSPKSKKNNRQRFDTSSSESDDEITAQPKKNRRQRIDSSHDASALQSETDKSLSKKKKAKRLSESVCDEDETNEKEITICVDNQKEKDDPLNFFNVIKKEPKTPQKDLNISTVTVTNIDEVEEVNVDENTSIMKSNQTSDPLQATIAENDEEDISDEGSISENEEITQNYESVLNNLNKSGSKIIKASNISLDLSKKTKKKSKEPIVDQLNLTQVKKSKKNKANAADIVAETKKQDKSLNKSVDKVAKQDTTMSEGSSDSIDMKLLFPEDSNDSEVVTDKKKEDYEETPGDCIPLKKTPGKTNIFENTDIANKSKDESILNVSGKKKNKRKSFQSQVTLEMGAPEDENLGFFIDTTGTLTDENKTDANISIKNSAKKNKQKNVSFTGREEIPLDDDSNEAPLEVSYRREKNKSKQDSNTTQNNEGTQENSPAVGTPNLSAKKKNKKGLNSSQNVSEIDTADDVAHKSNNVSLTNVEGSAKKKKNRLLESQTAPETEIEKPAETIQNISLGSAKKLKQRTVSENNLVEAENVNKENEVDVINQDLVAKKRKRKSSANQTVEEIIIKDDVKHTHDESIPTKNQKKKRKISNNDEDKTQVENVVTKTQEQEITHTHTATVENTKKKNKVQHLYVTEIDEVSGTTKKNKKRKERDEDDACKISKVLKQNSFDKVHVPRLPPNVINQLDNKPKKDVVEAKKTKIVATSEFVVEETKRRRNKPSNYLEESVYCINDDTDEKKQKRSIKNPKVLPFIPTASTSDSGFTTKFKVNVISQQIQFVAQSSDISNFKNDYLLKKRIKKLGTFEMYKRQRNIKIAKF